MSIVPPLTAVSYSPFPALGAPRIAGLLPAHIDSSTVERLPEISVLKPAPSRRDRQRALWAAQDAEIDMFVAGACERLAAVAAEVWATSTPHSVRPFIWEIAS